MKTIVFEFNQSIKPNVESTKENNIEKGKEFSSTLESMNNKVDKKTPSKDNINQTNKPQNSSTKNETEDKVEDTEELQSVEKEDNKKKIAYENLLFLSTNIVTLEDTNNAELDKEQDASIEVEELLLETKDIGIENFEENQTLVENEFDLESLLINKEIHDNNKPNLENNELPEENVELISKEIKPKIEMKEDVENTNEDITLDNELNSKLVNPAMEEEQPKNLEDNNSKELPKDNMEDNSIKASNKEDKTSNESLFSIHKQDIEYTKNISTEMEDLEPINPKEVIEQIVEKVKIDLTGEKNEIKIRLKPEILGEMLMNIEVTKNAVMAKVMVDNQRTKEIIESNLILLKEELKDTGLEIKTFEVFVGNSSDFNKHNPNQFNFNQNNKRLKIKAENKKLASNYEETLDIQNKTENIYSENTLNLLA